MGESDIRFIASERDPAGLNILEALDRIGSPYPSTILPKDIIYPERVDELDADLLVFLSRHKSESGKPTLTVHSTGNFGKADYGGNAHELQVTVANAKHNIYLELLAGLEGYTVSLEATHHGPSEFNTPLFFVELGSSAAQWADKHAAEFIAECVLAGLANKEKRDHAIGFGGGHYAPKFSAMQEIAFSHICPKYAADSLDEALVEQMIERTKDGVDYAVLDDKGLNSSQKTKIRAALAKAGLDEHK